MSDKFRSLVEPFRMGTGGANILHAWRILQNPARLGKRPLCFPGGFESTSVPGSDMT